ncbi:hypothetical protein BHM03_00040263 [Ensete ventricosum]|nr:hypothetical protein BHM03_00040263 [Ensete ventricosum]
MFSRSRTIGLPTWSIRHEEAGLTQAWRGQRSYDRPNTGKVSKVDIPQLYAVSRRKDHGRRGEVQQYGPCDIVIVVIKAFAPLRSRGIAKSTTKLT